MERGKERRREDWSAWRTFGMGALVLACLLAAVERKASDGAVKEIASAGWLIVAALAGRSAIAGLANGAGARGAAAALLSDAKPGDPAPPKGAP